MDRLMNGLKNRVSRILNKPKPVSDWNVSEALVKRQMGFSGKMSFQKKCKNSLFSVNRLCAYGNLAGNKNCASALAFDNTGQVVASISHEFTLNLWDWNKAKHICSYKTKHKERIQQMRFLNLSGGFHAVTAGFDGQVRYMYIGDQVYEDMVITRYADRCYGVAPVHSQPQVFFSVGANYLHRHDLRLSSDDRFDRLLNLDSGLYYVDTHPYNFNEFVVCTNDPNIMIFDQRNTKETVKVYTPFSDRNTFAVSAVYSHDGSEVLGTYREGIYLFDSICRESEYVSYLQGTKNLKGIIEAQFFGSKYVVSGSECGNLFIWDKDSGAILKCLDGEEQGEILIVTSHPHAPYLATSGLDNTIKMWLPLKETNRDITAIVQKNIAEVVNFVLFHEEE